MSDPIADRIHAMVADLDQLLPLDTERWWHLNQALERIEPDPDITSVEVSEA